MPALLVAVIVVLPASFATDTTGSVSATFAARGPGGPILVIAGPANPFSGYYGEILRAEGLNEFAVKDVAKLTLTTLAAHAVAIVGDIDLTPAQVAYWPSKWVKDYPGFFTGSGLPMRFADVGGQLIDVYQAATQMTDESGQTQPFTINTLLDRALGPQGYYGAFTANMHTDSAASAGSDAIVASAKARGVPVISGRQMLTWLDGRNGSSFNSIDWRGDKLSFRVVAGAGAGGLRGMVPATFGGKPLASITRDGGPISLTHEIVKGVRYAFFSATSGEYAASYRTGSRGPSRPRTQNAPAA